MKRSLTRNKKRLLYALLCGSLFWQTPLITHAAEEAATLEQHEFSLEGVEVTASRKHISTLPPVYAGGLIARGSQVGILGNKDFLDTPFNITSYTAEFIENQQARSLAGVVASDASVRSNATSTYQETWTVRGLALGNADVGFNGLYGIVPTFSSGTEFVERVELLKGPTALLNGMSPFGSIGGSINLIAKRAGEEPVTKLTTSYNGDSQLGGHLDIGRRFGKDQQFGVRFNGVHRNGDTRFDGESEKFSAATLGLDMRGQRFRASADFGYQQRNIDAPTSSLTLADGLSIPTVPKNTFNFNPPWTYVNSKDTFGVIHGEFDLNQDWTVFASAGARQNDLDYIFGFTEMTNSLGDLTTSIASYPIKSKTHTQEIGLRGQLTTGSLRHQLALSSTRLHIDRDHLINWNIGEYSSNLYHPFWGIRPDIPAIGKIPKASDTTLSSVVLSDTLSTPDDRLQLTLGFRRQQVEVDSFSSTNGAKTSSYHESATTPAVGLIVKIRPNFSFYGNYIEGLQQGPTAPDTAVNAGEVFAPYKSKQYEAGVKLDAGTFATTLSTFQIKQPSGLTDPITHIYSLNGKKRNRGLELNIFGEPVKGTRLQGGFMLMDSKLLSTANGTFDGNTSVGTPRWTATLGAEWDTPFQPGLTLTAQAIYNGSQYLNNANTLKVAPWTRFDVGARYTFKQGGTPVTVRATVANVFNKRHWIGTTGGYLAIGAPRTLLLSATMEL
ncbi:iron complex outermembrane recepter protein [Pelosinus fermentans]|uniref:TonB-dependent siderophore receptor n=1 Tax=Pelosinus fermentans B4 TaxID=1149862 RepID=I9LH49_9FIRM|nr:MULTISPECIES: TonB-dependent siderophore receptor [Pelosinus]EIW19711.1 TonB-dependent siderophore receptor [Pelosinus fermentans B4]OAM93016.1 TonB-dependent siderophore receptor [Pelosinus fermentans DSM 17108]SDQ64208.1 iron complex outermembrane recepter protein [Pelosinus fermentans]